MLFFFSKKWGRSFETYACNVTESAWVCLVKICWKTLFAKNVGKPQGYKLGTFFIEFKFVFGLFFVEFRLSSKSKNFISILNLYKNWKQLSLDCFMRCKTSIRLKSIKRMALLSSDWFESMHVVFRLKLLKYWIWIRRTFFKFEFMIF